jgi:hypothetical protein
MVSILSFPAFLQTLCSFRQTYVCNSEQSTAHRITTQQFQAVLCRLLRCDMICVAMLLQCCSLLASCINSAALAHAFLVLTSCQLCHKLPPAQCDPKLCLIAAALHTDGHACLSFLIRPSGFRGSKTLRCFAVWTYALGAERQGAGTPCSMRILDILAQGHAMQTARVVARQRDANHASAAASCSSISLDLPSGLTIQV